MDVSRRLFFRCNVRLSELVFKRFLEIVGHLVVQLLNAARPTHDVVTYVDVKTVAEEKYNVKNVQKRGKYRKKTFKNVTKGSLSVSAK